MQKIFQKLVAHLMVWSFVFLFVLSVVMAAQAQWLRALAAGVPASVMAWLILRNTLNTVQGLGPVYWTMRPCGPGTPLARRNFMREIDPPYRKGSGIQFRISPRRTLQIGLCQYMPYGDEVEVVGRWMDEASPDEIKTWVDEDAP